MILDNSFYHRTDVVSVATELLGKVLISKVGNERTAGMIVETEAYRGPDDKGSHAYGNRKTKRTKTMFLPGGISYIYLCYGIHNLFNVVSGPENVPHAVLIRAIEPIEGLKIMKIRRPVNGRVQEISNGPGKFTSAMGITLDHNGSSLTGMGKISIEDRGIVINKRDIHSSPRVGISYAEECAKWPWRFKIRNNLWTSKPFEVKY